MVMRERVFPSLRKKIKQELIERAKTSFSARVFCVDLRKRRRETPRFEQVL